MIGIIVTGHGGFAKGMSDAVNLLTGPPVNYESVDFLQEHSSDDLELNLKNAIVRLKDCKGIIIFTDLAGGVPYKCATSLSKKSEQKIVVISGTNLGMLTEVTMSRNLIFDVNDLSEMVIGIGKDQIFMFNKN